MTPTKPTAPAIDPALVERFILAMPLTVRGDHAKAVAKGNATEAKRIIVRYVLSQMQR